MVYSVLALKLSATALFNTVFCLYGVAGVMSSGAQYLNFNLVCLGWRLGRVFLSNDATQNRLHRMLVAAVFGGGYRYRLGTCTVGNRDAESQPRPDALIKHVSKQGS